MPRCQVNLVDLAFSVGWGDKFPESRQPEGLVTCFELAWWRGPGVSRYPELVSIFGQGVTPLLLMELISRGGLVSVSTRFPEMDFGDPTKTLAVYAKYGEILKTL
jgi:hypothetical protein